MWYFEETGRTGPEHFVRQLLNTEKVEVFVFVFVFVRGSSAALLSLYVTGSQGPPRVHGE